MNRLDRNINQVEEREDALSFNNLVLALKLSDYTRRNAKKYIHYRAKQDNLTGRLINYHMDMVDRMWDGLPDHLNNRSYMLKGKPHHTADEWDAKKLQYNNKCAYCGAVGKLTKDHILPVTRGGSDTIDNIIPACWPCNQRKKAQLVEYFKEGLTVKIL